MSAESRRVGCLGLTDAVEAESSSGSESGSPRHDDSAAAQQVHLQPIRATVISHNNTVSSFEHVDY